MRGRLLTVRNRLLDVRGMRARVVSGVGRIVDAGAGDADCPANSLAADRDVRAAHPDRQAWTRFRNVDRQSWKDRYAPIKSEVAHDYRAPASCPAAARPKKSTHHLRGFGLHDAADDFEAMVQPAVSADVVHRAEGTGLGVARAVNDSRHAGIEHRADAHDARLERDVNRHGFQPVRFERRCGGTDCQDFGVRGRIAEPDGPVVARADDLSIRDRDSADWHFAVRLGTTGFSDGGGHKIQMFSARHVTLATAPAGSYSRLTLAKP